jgi:hypothetical protein
MKISEPRLRTLLSQAERNLTNGKLAAAETMYRQILDEAPQSEEAWLGLGNTLTDLTEKRAAYERALTIAPGMTEATVALAVLDGAPVAQPVAPVAKAAPVTTAATVTAPAPAKTAAPVVKATDPNAALVDTEFDLYCYRHPERSTSLRCYSCQKPICIDCAKKTPVGYICPVCLREAEDAFFNNKPTDYLIAALVSFPISLLIGFLLANFQFGGFFFYIIIFFISGAVGGFVGRITKRAIGYRRGRYLPQLVVAMMILGVLIPVLPVLLALFAGNLGALSLLIRPGIYLFVASSAAYWQMR